MVHKSNTMTSSFIEVKVSANCKLFLAFLQHTVISFTNKRFNLKFLPNFAAMLQKLLPGHIPKQASSTWCLLSSPSQRLPGNSQPNCAIMFLPNESPQIKEHRSLGLFYFKSYLSDDIISVSTWTNIFTYIYGVCSLL